MNEIAWTHLHAGTYRLPCPACARHEKDRTCGVTVESGRGVAHCFRCSYVETWRDELRRTTLGKPLARPIVSRAHETLSDFGLGIVRECRALSGVALDYLRARNCAIPPADGDLRYHSELHHPSGYTGPALVGIVTDAVTREPISLHRTWINRDGTKASVEPARLLLGGHRKQGGVIRLWPDEAVTMGLGIAEGIETALSLAHAYEPVWSLIDAGNLAAFPVLRGIDVLLIARDNDPAGRDAAEKCANRWAAAGAHVSITEQAENDLNDLAREAA